MRSLAINCITLVESHCFGDLENNLFITLGKDFAFKTSEKYVFLLPNQS